MSEQEQNARDTRFRAIALQICARLNRWEGGRSLPAVSQLRLLIEQMDSKSIRTAWAERDSAITLMKAWEERALRAEHYAQQLEAKVRDLEHGAAKK